MKQSAFMFAAVLACLIVPAAASQSEGIGDLEWLVGTWARSGGRIEETWRRLGDTLLEGASYIVDGETGTKRQDEWILLTSMDGDVYYITKPRGNPEPTAFQLVATGDDTATFENRNHDFPQRIIYKRVGEAAMTVTIEGPGENGETRSIDFAYERKD